VYTSVKRAAIHRTPRRHIARDRQTWSPTAPVVRRPWLIFRATPRGKPATTRSRTVKKPVARPCPADTHARRFATPDLAVHACR
jgi:hypothetical protein